MVCGKEVSPRLVFVRRGQGCRFCAGNAPLPPDEAAEVMRAVGLEPLEPYRNSSSPWRCRCVRCGKEVAPKYSSIRRGGGCRSCAGTAPISEADAEAQMRAAGLEPLDAYPGLDDAWRCRCTKCHSEVSPSLFSVRYKGGGCRYCLPNHYFSPADAEAQMRSSGFEPLEPYPGANNPWRCRCEKCGNEVTPRLGNIRQGSGGCRYCAPYGFDPQSPGLVYLLHHPTYGAHKVGIAEQASVRVQKFAGHGWEIVRTLPFAVASDAYAVEQAVLAPYRAASLCPFLTRAEMPLGGHTETIDAEAVSLLDLWAEVVAAAEAIAREPQSPSAQ